MTDRRLRFERFRVGSLVAVVGALFLSAAPGCKKKEEKTKEKAASEKPESREKAAPRDTREARGASETKVAGREGPAPGKTTAAITITVDPELQTKLAALFGAPKSFDKLINRVKGSQAAITAMGDKGKVVYPMYLAAAESLKKCAELATTKKFADIAPHIVPGVVAGTMIVELLAKQIGSTAKQAALAAKSLNIGKAKKLGRHAKTLGSLAKVAKELLKKYALVLEAMIKSKSHTFRVGAFQAAVKAFKNVDPVTKALVGTFLKKIQSDEKDEKAKVEMGNLLKSLLT